MTAPTVLPLPVSQDSKKRNHLPQLDVLRAIAIIAVFFYHCLTFFHRDDQLPWHGWLRNYTAAENPAFLWAYPITFGWLGVPLFFVLSGFVIHYSFLQAKEFNTLNFLWRRLWRIYPAYFTALLAFSLLRRDLPSGIVHAFFLQNFRTEDFFAVNPSFWSIAVEMQFYLLYPLLLVIRQRLGMQRTFWLSVALSLVTRLAIFLIVPESRNSISPITILWANVPVLWMDWIIGACVAEAFHSGKRFYSNTTSKMLPLLLVVAVLSTQVRYGFIISFSLFSLFFGGVVEHMIHREFHEQTPLSKILIPIGIWSYSIYLWHQPIIMKVDSLLQKRFPEFTISVGNYLLLSALIALPILGIAYLSYRFVEMPAMRSGSSLWKRFVSKPSS